MLSWGTYEKPKIVLLEVFEDGFNRTLSIYPWSLSLLKIHQTILLLSFFLFFKNSLRKTICVSDSNCGALERQANALTTMQCCSPKLISLMPVLIVQSYLMLTCFKIYQLKILCCAKYCVGI